MAKVWPTATGHAADCRHKPTWTGRPTLFAMMFEHGEDEDDYHCAHCRHSLRPGDPYVALNVEWGDGPNTYGDDYFWFCSQEHAAAYLGSSPLPPPERYDAADREKGWFRRRFGGRRDAAFTVFWGLMLVANLGFYVLGFVTWLRWVWSS